MEMWEGVCGGVMAFIAAPILILVWIGRLAGSLVLFVPATKLLPLSLHHSWTVLSIVIRECQLNCTAPPSGICSWLQQQCHHSISTCATQGAGAGQQSPASQEQSALLASLPSALSWPAATGPLEAALLGANTVGSPFSWNASFHLAPQPVLVLALAAHFSINSSLCLGKAMVGRAFLWTAWQAIGASHCVFQVDFVLADFIRCVSYFLFCHCFVACQRYQLPL